MATVYMHTVKINGKRYIGQCVGDVYDRWGSNGHRYKGQLFYSAIQKYGWENISHELIAENLSQEEADNIEREYIQKYKSNDRRYGYNIESGGKIGSAGLKGGNNPNAKAVKCIETGEIWECTNYCAKDLHVNCASLQESLYHGYKCKGNHYKYIDDNNYVMNKDPYSVICLETGQIWKTVNECANEIGVTSKTVARYCSGLRKCPLNRTYKYYVA